MIGFSIVQDVGDGRATATSAPTTYTSAPAFLAAQTFPLRYLSPQGKLSFRITEKIRWNVGYQHYAYRESFSTFRIIGRIPATLLWHGRSDLYHVGPGLWPAAVFPDGEAERRA